MHRKRHACSGDIICSADTLQRRFLLIIPIYIHVIQIWKAETFFLKRAAMRPHNKTKKLDMQKMPSNIKPNFCVKIIMNKD